MIKLVFKIIGILSTFADFIKPLITSKCKWKNVEFSVARPTFDPATGKLSLALEVDFYDENSKSVSIDKDVITALAEKFKNVKIQFDPEGKVVTVDGDPEFVKNFVSNYEAIKRNYKITQSEGKTSKNETDSTKQRRAVSLKHKDNGRNIA